MKPSVTMLVTLKNSKDTIKKCIDSILNLKYPNYKVYVIDAFSDDGSFEILKSYGKKIKLEQLKGWPPKAYNWAIKRIKTDYIALIDADCVVTKNWLKELIKGFDEKDVLMTAGFCKTPKTKNKLQKIIGIELEDRYNHFGKYITAAPTMNVMFPTKIAKRLRYNEKLRVAYDKDFCFRLLKLGKILYNPKAIIYHFHRATWKKLFKQQYSYGKYQLLAYSKAKKRIFIGDKISKLTMMLQILFAYLFTLFLLIGVFIPNFFYLSLIFLILIFLLYTSDVIKLSKKPSDTLWFYAIFIIRHIAWCFGVLVGFINLLFKG